MNIADDAHHQRQLKNQHLPQGSESINDIDKINDTHHHHADSSKNGQPLGKDNSSVPKCPDSSSDSLSSKCEIIHVAIVCAGYNSSRSVVTLIKSILFLS